MQHETRKSIAIIMRKMEVGHSEQFRVNVQPIMSAFHLVTDKRFITRKDVNDPYVQLVQRVK